MHRRAPSYWTVRRNIRSEYAAAVSDLELAEIVDFDSGVSDPYTDPNNCAITRATTSDLVGLRNDDTAERSLDVDEFGDAFCYGADADHSSDTSSELECSEFDDSSHECESGLVSLKDKLTAWALDCDVPKTTVGALLRVLKPYHPELPIDARALLNTPRVVQEIATLLGGGQ